MAFLALVPLVIDVAEGAEVAIGATEAAEAAAAASETAATAAESAAADEAAAAEAETTAAQAELEENGTAESTLGRTFLRSAARFTKWVAKQAIEFALIDAGFRALKLVIKELKPGDETIHREMVDYITRINDASPVLNKAVNDWLVWSDHHFDKRDSFGEIDVMNTQLQLFDVLQNKLAALNDIRNKKIVPLAKGAGVAKTFGALNNLTGALQVYAADVLKVSNFIAAHGGAMMEAGLDAHQAEIKAACQELYQ